ncbi:hypothetical protein BCV28_14990 [Vibrio cyclitrophicus]
MSISKRIYIEKLRAVIFFRITLPRFREQVFSNYNVNLPLLAFLFISISLVIRESDLPLNSNFSYLEFWLVKGSHYDPLLFALSSGYILAYFIRVLDVWLPEKSKNRKLKAILARDYDNVVNQFCHLMLLMEKDLNIVGYYSNSESSFSNSQLFLRFQNELPDMDLKVFRGEFVTKYESIICSLDAIFLYQTHLDLDSLSTLIKFQSLLNSLEEALKPDRINNLKVIHIYDGLIPHVHSLSQIGKTPSLFDRYIPN